MSKYVRREPKKPSAPKPKKKYASGPASEEGARRTERVVLRLPPHLGDELRLRAAKAGVTMSGYVAEQLQLEKSYRFHPDQGLSSNRPDLAPKQLLLEHFRRLRITAEERAAKGASELDIRRFLREEFRRFAIEDFRDHHTEPARPLKTVDQLLDEAAAEVFPRRPRKRP